MTESRLTKMQKMQAEQKISNYPIRQGSNSSLKQQVLTKLNNESSLSHSRNQKSNFLVQKNTESGLSRPKEQSNEKNDKSQRSSVIASRNSDIIIENSLSRQSERFIQADNQLFKQQQDPADTPQQQISHKSHLNGYFGQINKLVQGKRPNTIAKKYSNYIQEHLDANIKTGVVRIHKHREDIQNLLAEFKVSQEQLKIIQRRAILDLKNQKIKLLDPYQIMKAERQQIARAERSNEKDEQDPSKDKNIVNQFMESSVLSKEQHKRLIRKFISSNKRNEERKRQKIMSEIQRERSISEQRKRNNQTNQKRQKELKRLSIESKMIEKKKQREQLLERQKISNRRFHQMKNQKFLYLQAQEKFQNQILGPALEQKKTKLKQLRDFHKKYDMSELKKHQLEYLQKKSQASSKTNSRHKIQSFHYCPPERARRLTELLQEQKLQAKIKYEEKKRLVQDNKLKQINFISEIRIKHRPKIDAKKRQEIQLRLKSEQTDLINRKDEKDLKQMQLKFFEQAKQVGKKLPKQKTEGNDSMHKMEYANQFNSVKIITKLRPKRNSQKKVNISLSSNSDHRHTIVESKRRQIRKLIESDELKREQKLQKLKIQNERINQIYKRKQRFFRENQDDENTRQQAINLLLNSIQTKIGIIEVSTKE